MIPLDILSKIPSAVQRVETTDILLRIEMEEDHAGIPLQERYIYHFDLKEGVSESQLTSVSHADRAWIESRLKLGKRTLSVGPLLGYGQSVPSQILASNELCSGLKDHIRTRRWWAMFGEQLTEALWVLVAARRSFT
jgi:hypothetical protein